MSGNRNNNSNNTDFRRTIQKIISKAMLFMGVTCIVIAALIVIINLNAQKKANENSKKILKEARKIIPTALDNASQISKSNKTIPIMINGEKYIGILNIPEIGVELPVSNIFSYDMLAIVPCLYNEMPGNNGFAIAAHNFPSHFGKINMLHKESKITFTDAEGYVYEYVVEKVEIVKDTDVKLITSKKYDLTLFTCTFDGKKRIAVRCKNLI